MELDGSGRREEPMAFDLWVKRSLRDRYGGVAREQLPQELVELLSEHGQDQFVGD